MNNYPIILFLILSGIFTNHIMAQDTASIARNTEQYLDQLAKNDEFSGAVLIAKDGKPIFRKAYGMANLSYDIPNREDTKFNLGSMNKMITATAVMQLMESGKISPDDYAIKYLPDYPNKDVANSVTIHQLLTHTSGMGSYWTKEYMEASKDQFRAVKDYLPLFVVQPLQFEPGSRFEYSNAGYMLLGLIIESVTGETYFDYVRKNIYEPLGMKNTDAYEMDHPTKNLAIGYTASRFHPGEMMNNNYMHIVKGGPAGGGYSTVDDLLLFANAIRNNKLLKPETTALMTTGKSADGTYGYGFSDQMHNEHRYIGHTGGFAGIADELMIFPESGYTVVILTNRDFGYRDARNFIIKEIAGTTPQIESYLFTKDVIATARDKGYNAGVKAIAANKNKKLNERLINNAGYQELFKHNIKTAIDIFRLNTYAFPESANAFDSLGEAYYNDGNKNLAIESYKKSLSLDPKNTNAKEMLEKIKSEM